MPGARGKSALLPPPPPWTLFAEWPGMTGGGGGGGYAKRFLGLRP